MGQSLRRTLGLDKPRTPATPPQADNAKPGKADKVELPAKQIITYLCGHKVGVHNLHGQPCPSCSRKRRAEGRARREEARQGAGRLPDASAFLLEYDAAAQQWSGTLTVGALSFEAKAPAVFRLLQVLDRMYRQQAVPAAD
jgi:hypothetical protein